MQSVTLIGMPGAGKSTIGILLAKELGLDFIDTDVAIQVREGKCLQTILDETDYLNLRHIEERVLLEADLEHKVVSTGGSAVFSEAGMKRLKGLGRVVYLDVPLTELRHRIHNYDNRGIARRPDQSFEELFDERNALYLRYADIDVQCEGKSIDEVLGEVVSALQENA